MGYQKFDSPIMAYGFKELPTATNPLGGIQASELAQHVLQDAVVDLTAAQLEAMYATPISILPAPGQGFAIIVKELVFELIGGATPFSGGGGIVFPYHGTSVYPHTSSIPADVATDADTTTITELGLLQAPTVIPPNTGIDITNATAAFAGGNGTAKVFIQYRIITL